MSASQVEIEAETLASVTFPVGTWETIITAVARHYTYDSVKELVPSLVAQVRDSAAIAVQAK